MVSSQPETASPLFFFSLPHKDYRHNSVKSASSASDKVEVGTRTASQTLRRPRSAGKETTAWRLAHVTEACLYALAASGRTDKGGRLDEENVGLTGLGPPSVLPRWPPTHNYVARGSLEDGTPPTPPTEHR
jgi:hypothetical protein